MAANVFIVLSQLSSNLSNLSLLSWPTVVYKFPNVTILLLACKCLDYYVPLIKMQKDVECKLMILIFRESKMRRRAELCLIRLYGRILHLSAYICLFLVICYIVIRFACEFHKVVKNFSYTGPESGLVLPISTGPVPYWCGPRSSLNGLARYWGYCIIEHTKPTLK